jgi:hypothetical protein
MESSSIQEGTSRFYIKAPRSKLRGMRSLPDSEVIRLKPDYAKARYNLALTLMRKENPNVTMPHVCEAILLKPSDHI